MTTKTQTITPITSDTRLVGESPLLKQMLQIVDQVAQHDCVVLLEGESGTGKELIAQRLHEKSKRDTGPFIPVNCPAVSETLFESQFYGHVKGSFTGAAGDTLGVVRAADRGTLFLDEIGELPLHLQPKLLRLLQEKEITPVGATRPVKVDVRFVAATNRSLARAVQNGKFRLDLYHRLNVVRVQIPPLRNRHQDILVLTDHFLDTFAAEYGMDRREVPTDIRDALLSYNWPGNVRELSCWVERLYAAGLPPMAPQSDIWDDSFGQTSEISPAPVAAASLASNELDAIRNALAQAGGNKSAAAKSLDIHRTTLIRKLKQFGLE
jgi:transcriptional regulator with PAS, ATPase and Fis domain